MAERWTPVALQGEASTRPKPWKFGNEMAHDHSDKLTQFREEDSEPRDERLATI